MTTIVPDIFQINGVIDPDQSVMSNLNTLCNAAGCWLTYDVNAGTWSVVINRPGDSLYSFTDSNILGPINLGGSGLSEAYNKVTVEFPHRDLRDETDYVDMVIPPTWRYPNEVDNTLHIRFDCINNPTQAKWIGAVELNQSRVDRIIEFKTDFSAIGLKAGDIIDVTAEMYGFAQKKFRITKLVEEDSDAGGIVLSITALEYDEDVYSAYDLLLEERNKVTGIIPKSMNSVVKENDAQAIIQQISTTGDSTAKIVVNKADMGAVCQAFNQYNGDSPESPGWSSNPAAWVPMATPNREWTEEFQVDDTYRFIHLDFQRATVTLKYPFYDRITDQIFRITAEHVPPMYYRIECICTEDRSTPDAIYYAGQTYTLRTVIGQLNQGSVSAHIPNPPKGAYIIKMWPAPFYLPSYLNPQTTVGNSITAIHFYGFSDPNGVFHRTLVSLFK